MSTKPRMEFPEPTPELLARQPWRADPRWVDARERHMADIPGETADAGFVRGIRGLYEMYLVEAEYESKNPALANMRNFRTDPRWLRARAAYIEDQRDDEDEEEAYARRVDAAVRLRDIEKEYLPKTSNT